ASATGLPNPPPTTDDRLESSIFKPNPPILYAVFGNCPDPLGNGPVLGGACMPLLFNSTNSGQTWTQQNASLPGNYTGSYSRYTHVLTIHPSDSATIYLGRLRLFKSVEAGQTFTTLGTNIHPDHHALIFPDPANPSRIYNASDGG